MSRAAVFSRILRLFRGSCWCWCQQVGLRQCNKKHGGETNVGWLNLLGGVVHIQVILYLRFLQSCRVFKAVGFTCA